MNTPNLDGICVLVDGGCLNNNKPVTERSMYGSMTVFNGGKQVESSVDLYHTEPQDETKLIHKYDIMDMYQHASNNMAEVVMVRTAVEYVYALVKRMAAKGRTLTSVTVMSDSEWALCVATGAYKIKPQNEIAFHNDLTTLKHVKGLVEELGCTINFQHVNNLWVKTVLGH
jgi:ribonuclease HI